jgi:hypothetical protein
MLVWKDAFLVRFLGKNTSLDADGRCPCRLLTGNSIPYCLVELMRPAMVTGHAPASEECMALVDECRWVARLILHSFDPSPTDFTRKTVAFRSADKMTRQDALDDARLDLIDDGDSEAIADRPQD